MPMTGFEPIVMATALGKTTHIHIKDRPSAPMASGDGDWRNRAHRCVRHLIGMARDEGWGIKSYLQDDTTMVGVARHSRMGRKGTETTKLQNYKTK